jgi:hypothetical protein
MRKLPSAILLMQFAAVVAVAPDRSAIRKASLEVQGRRTVESIPDDFRHKWSSVHRSHAKAISYHLLSVRFSSNQRFHESKTIS